LDKKQLSERDICISITGDRGMIGLVPAGLPPAYINQHIALARPSSCLSKRYLAMFFSSPLHLQY
jgi:type I restriction enzyme S subunit